jgi:hypothetical protein
VNQQEVTFTYSGDTLKTITYTGDTGNGSYIFDSNGRLTGGLIHFTSGQPGEFTGVYTYDSNGDPTSVHGSGEFDDNDGHTSLSIDLTGTFLTNKTSLLPYSPIFAPFSAYFSFIPFLSKHLLDSWDVKINGSKNGVPIPENHFLIKYTYTYDSNGNVATMVSTANSNNKYTFTYSDCK